MTLRASRWLLVFLALILCAVAFFLYPRGPVVTVVIAPGQSASEIGRMLDLQSVIRFPLSFRIATKIMAADRDMKPGVYHLKRHMPAVMVVWKLTHHIPFVRVVIPEGFNARQIAERLEANGVTSARAFVDYVTANRLEGYLFPTTYYLGSGMQAEAVAHLMHQEFAKAVEPEFDKYPSPPHRLSRNQVVILASIVEREAVLSEEKPMIAAVYLNRLAKRKSLEADPTVQYAIDPGRWKKGLILQDLQTDSPYNTYTHFGLPPGPICSPSVTSVRAVLAPAQTDALYFVADNSGGHTFNVSYAEHLKAKEKAKQQRRLMRLLQLKRKE